MTTKPAYPVAPGWYQNRVADYKFALKTRDHDVIVEARMALSPLTWTPEEQAEANAYNGQVRAYNAWVDAQNQARKARAQAAKTAAQRAATHAATCSFCFTIHAGECY